MVQTPALVALELLVQMGVTTAPVVDVTDHPVGVVSLRGLIGASPGTRAWRRILIFASRWAQIESLYRFNAKFQPAWEPRFILYPGVSGLARVAVAYLEAEAFITYPRLVFWRRRDRRAVEAPVPLDRRVDRSQPGAPH